jgi:hypothetical protein
MILRYRITVIRADGSNGSTHVVSAPDVDRAIELAAVERGYHVQCVKAERLGGGVS